MLWVDRLGGLDELPLVLLLMCIHGLVIIRLHKVRDASGCSRVEHLLAVLTLLRHHLLMLLLLLLELVVESLELSTLAWLTWWKDCVNVLTKRYFGTEAIHLVVIGVTWHAERRNLSFLLRLWLTAGRELVEVRRLLGTFVVTSILIVIANRVTLKFVDSTSNWFDLNGMLFHSLVYHHFVASTLWCGWIWITVHAHELLFVTVGRPLTRGTLLGQGLITATQSWRSTIVTVSHHLEVVGFATELASTQVFGLILDNNLLKQVVFLIDVLFHHWLALPGPRVAVLRQIHIVLGWSFHIWIQIFQVNLVVILVLKRVQTAIGALLKKELTQVGRWNEVVCLGMERATALVGGIALLALVQAWLSILTATFFAHSKGTSFWAINALCIDRFLGDLAAMNILERVLGVWLLEIPSILVHAWGSLTELHCLLVTTMTRFHSYLRGDHVLRRALRILSRFTSLGELGVIHRLLVAEILSSHQVHVCHSRYSLAHRTHLSDLACSWLLVQRVLVLIWSHRGSWLGRFASATTVTVSSLVVVLVLVIFILSNSLCLLLSISLDELLDFRLAQVVEPWLSKGLGCR